MKYLEIPADIRDWVSYDPASGEFCWKAVGSKYRPHEIGDRADKSRGSRGYRKINFRGQHHTAHRVAYFLMTGEQPPYQIDHENRNPADNRWSNLRPATQSQNMANRGLQSNNSSGAIGVSFDKATGAWRAQVKVNGNLRHLGYFPNLDTASTAAARAEPRLRGVRSMTDSDLATVAGSNLR